VGAPAFILAAALAGALSQAAALSPAPPAPAAQPAPPSTPATLTQIRVQGNVAMSDEEVLRLAGVATGMPVDDRTAEEVASRLRATGRFERVEVLKRFASIADPTAIALVIIVDEGRVHVELTGDPNQPTRVVKDRGPHLLFLPILDAEDGYGLAYGVRVTLPNAFGARSRLSIPLTWGGDKRASLELDKTMTEGPLSRVTASASIGRRENPFYEQDDTRDQLSVRGERALASSVRIGATAGWQHVSFLGTTDSFTTVGLDAVVDTRIDPMLARNAVYARVALDHLSFASDAVNRLDLEARGYIGLFAQNILVVGVQRQDADAPLPPYLKPLLGGMENLLGFRYGTAAGDTLLAGSVELLVPLTPSLKIGKLGVSAFTDAGAVYDKDQRLADQTLRRGVGGSVWFSAAFLRLKVAVAHGLGGSTRVHVGGGVMF
jgi:outer membrane protein assembly factor BamA